MASSPKDSRFSFNSLLNKDSEQEEDERKTLFRVVCSQMKEKMVLQRMMLIARLPHHPADVTELGDHYRNLIVRLNTERTREHITGLLLICPTSLLHVMESSRELLNSVLKDMQQQPDSVLLDVKIVFMTHNLQSRLFSTWSYKVLHADQIPSKPAVKHVEEEESTEALVCRVLSALHKLKEHLDTTSFSGTFLDENPELIYCQTVLEKLLHQEEFLSLQQHLEMYNSHLNVSVDIGQVNPRSFLPTI